MGRLFLYLILILVLLKTHKTNTDVGLLKGETEKKIQQTCTDSQGTQVASEVGVGDIEVCSIVPSKDRKEEAS